MTTNRGNRSTSVKLAVVACHHAAVQPLLDLHRGMGVAHPLPAGQELERRVIAAHGVVLGYGALVFEAEHAR